MARPVNPPEVVLEPFLPTEAGEIAWHRDLTQFREEIYPIFKPQGFSFPEAYLAWSMNRLINVVSELTPPSE